MEKSLFKQSYEFRETKGIILSEKKLAIRIAEETLQRHRGQIEEYIVHNPIFLDSIKPIYIDDGPIAIKKMSEASLIAGVGPMAAVAGVIADLAVDAMIGAGAKVAVVEDGGEASAISQISIDIALSAGSNVLSKQLGFRLENFPIGVATSSGKFSHALSFGDADAVTVFAKNAGLADAVATSVGNVVKGNDIKEAIEVGLRKGMSIQGVKGVFILYDDLVGQAGEIPKIISISQT